MEMSFEEEIEQLKICTDGKKARDPIVGLFEIIETESTISEEELENWIREA